MKNSTSGLIVAEARRWIGTPYLHQASRIGIGCDCLGLVRGIWRAVYGAEPEAVPPYSPAWAETGRREQLAEAARRHLIGISDNSFGAGDLLMFRWRPHVPAKHLAIASGAKCMIHAQQHAAVCEVPISPWWHRHLAHVFRFPESRT